MNLTNLDSHFLCHLREIISSFKIKQQWRNKLTVIVPYDGKEYSWPRILNEKEISIFLRDLFGIEISKNQLKKERVGDNEILLIFANKKEVKIIQFDQKELYQQST